jgi:hypothetical protein
MKHASISVALVVLAALGTSQAMAGDTQGAAKPALPKALSSDDLSALSGGAGPSGVAISQSTLTAVNAGNSVNAQSLVTGDVNVGAGAFNGFNGVGNFVFNTGNNNNVQGSLNITILTPN